MGVSGASRARSAVARAVLGPWPLFPAVVFAAMLLLVLLQNLQVALLGRFGDCRFACVQLPTAVAPAIAGQFGADALRPIDPVIVVGNALLTAGAIALVLTAGARLMSRRGTALPSRSTYLAIVLLASLAGAVVRVYVLSPILLSVPGLSLPGIASTTVRTFISVTIVQTISGMLTRRYVEQATLARDALATVRRQQRLVVESDERARRSVAEFLHDRVQADLLLVAMELRASMGSAGAALRDRLERAVAELERIRSSEVRSASRRLSPAFASIGLDTALEELAASWDPAMAVRVTFDAASHEALTSGAQRADLVTAIYRIAEQGLLNAASHGRASRVDIAIAMPEARTITLRIEDDGRGLPSGTLTRGAGSAVMDAWCAAADGDWSWSANRHGGTSITAQFALRLPPAG